MTSSPSKRVTTVAEFQAASSDPRVVHIHLAADLNAAPSLRLSPGQTLHGPGTIAFAAGQQGLQLTCDNHVEDLTLVADADKLVVFNDTRAASLGRLSIRKLTLTGVVQLLARDAVLSGHVEAHDIKIVAADARGFQERPKGYGVEVIPGAFTLWNQQRDASVTITADLTGLSVGRAGAPVRGSGIMVSGAGDEGGRLLVRRLETGPVHSDGGIASGTPDRITGGVFTVYGTHVDIVRNLGPVTTYGPNDMVLDNWGSVDHWVAEEKITSFGPSGIGFVNFGQVHSLQVKAPIETFGQGARGFNVYTGTVRSATFDRVVTHADGAVGIQIGQPVGRIAVLRGIETRGGTGDSLVKGKVVTLSAIGLSVKPGGSVQEVDVSGGIVTHGDGIAALELQGTIETLRVAGHLGTAGTNPK